MKKTKAVKKQEAGGSVGQGYEVSAARQRRAATAAALEVINSHEAHITALRQNMQHELVQVVNFMADQGRQLEIITQREQLDFGFYNGFADKLPRSWDFATAQKRMSLARALPQAVKSIEELQNEMRKWTLQQLELLPEIRGLAGAAGDGQAVNLQDSLGQFCTRLSVFKQALLKVFTEKPVDRWSPPEREKFLAETEWVAEARAKLV